MFFKRLLSHSAKTTHLKSERTVSDVLSSCSQCTIKECLKQVNATQHGLTMREARLRIFRYGRNEVAKEKRSPWPVVLLKNLKDPLSILLAALAFISFLTKDLKATIMIGSMVVLSVLLRFIQEVKADKAAEKLRAMVHTTTKVLRGGKIHNLPISSLVPGDIISLSAGDMVPADVRLIESKDLFINQATLTGEAMPAEKHIDNTRVPQTSLEAENLCFLGTNVESGTATAVVVATGHNTYLGGLAQELVYRKVETSFDLGIKKFTWLIMKFILVMVPLTFLFNGLVRHNWVEAFLFAVAVAVGLAPEMLPMIVAVNLSKGAQDMARKKTIVKHLDSIQNFGAMDILCTDKTGTLTEGRVVLEKHLDVNGNESEEVLNYGFLNSYYQTGLNNLLDGAVLRHEDLKKKLAPEKNYKKIDEMPFDFIRRRMSVVVEHGVKKEQMLICKGAVEEVMLACSSVEMNGKIIDFKKAEHGLKHKLENELNSEGFRVVAVAYKKIQSPKERYEPSDEKDLILVGFLAFLDPPKESAKTAISALNDYGIKVKILTGDNELVARKVCAEVGLKVDKIILGGAVKKMNDKELVLAVEEVEVFAKLTPAHKERIIKVLRAAGHSVGFMGDGINDAPALRAADVGISVDTAADIAKESSDIILLEKSLMVLRDGVIEGRKIFGNVVKYIQMSASSNFGNMFSVVGGSLFLPFLPMRPLQILTNNLLYDISQTAIPTDHVDPEYLLKPRKWEISNIKKFILYIGPISSLYDYATYFAMLFIFNCWNNAPLFQTGWFVESLVSQTLVIYIIRTNKIPFLQSWPSKTLLFSTLAIVGIGAYLPFSFLAGPLGFAPLPPLYWLVLLIFIITYFILTQLVKVWFIKKYHAE